MDDLVTLIGLTKVIDQTHSQCHAHQEEYMCSSLIKFVFWNEKHN